MASPLDIVEIPGYPGLYTRRIVVEMWQRAGSPRINDAGRLFQKQLDARLAFEGGWGSPADDPRRPDLYPLAHVRFGALDVINSARSAMIAAGFEYPYDYEPWHGQLPNIYSYPLVTSIPDSASTGYAPLDPATPIIQEDDMAYPIRVGLNRWLVSPGQIKHFTDVAASDLTKNIVAANDAWIDLTVAQFLTQLDSFGIPRDVVNVSNGYVLDPKTGKFALGGMWSWARATYENTKGLVAAPTQPEVVEPPKA